MRGLPLFMWNRDSFIAIGKEFGQLLDIDKKISSKDEMVVARIRVGSQVELISQRGEWSSPETDVVCFPS